MQHLQEDKGKQKRIGCAPLGDWDGYWPGPRVRSPLDGQGGRRHVNQARGPDRPSRYVGHVQSTVRGARRPGCSRLYVGHEDWVCSRLYMGHEDWICSRLYVIHENREGRWQPRSGRSVSWRLVQGRWERMIFDVSPLLQKT